MIVLVIGTCNDKKMKGMLCLCSSVLVCTIRPIVAYESEVWSADILKLISKPNLVDKAPFERVNNKVCKYIADMPSRASNFAIKAELGREPIFSFICSQAFRHWRELIGLDSCREILKGAYESELEIHKSGNTSWVTFIAKLLD